MRSIPAIKETKVAAETLCCFKAQPAQVHDTVSNAFVLSLEAPAAKHSLTADCSAWFFVMHKTAS